MRTVFSKTISFHLMTMPLVGPNGCLTTNMVERAKGTAGGSFFNPVKAVDPNTGRAIQLFEPHPAYYALLPLTFPADILTSNCLL
jgi:hypothetical protein